jgi:hypothetical protein
VADRKNRRDITQKPGRPVIERGTPSKPLAERRR